MGFEERKAEILAVVQAEAHAAARRRRRARGAGAAVVGLAAVTLVLVGRHGGGASVPAPVVERGGAPAPTEPAVVELASYAMSDAELVAALEEEGEGFVVVWGGEKGARVERFGGGS